MSHAEEWELVGTIITDGGKVSIDGINPWQHEWEKLDEPPIMVPHPQYPSQFHTMDIYKIKTADKSVRFAAGEFSNLAWGFYLPKAAPTRSHLKL